jgi:hypothetical protein
VTCRLRMFLAVVFGRIRAVDAVQSGDLTVTVGSSELAERAFDLLSGSDLGYPVYLGV